MDTFLVGAGAITGGVTEMIRGNDPVQGMALGASTAYAVKDLVKDTGNTKRLLEHAIEIGIRMSPVAIISAFSPDPDSFIDTTFISGVITYGRTRSQREQQQDAELRALRERQEAMGEQGERWWEAPPPAEEQPVPPRPSASNFRRHRRG